MAASTLLSTFFAILATVIYSLVFFKRNKMSQEYKESDVVTNSDLIPGVIYCLNLCGGIRIISTIIVLKPVNRASLNGVVLW